MLGPQEYQSKTNGNGFDPRAEPGARSWDRAPNRRHAAQIKRYEQQQIAALRQGARLLGRKTCGGHERVLSEMQQVARAYAKYHEALTAIIRLELF
jgi:hypothetical protein